MYDDVEKEMVVIGNVEFKYKKGVDIVAPPAISEPEQTKNDDGDEDEDGLDEIRIVSVRSTNPDEKSGIESEIDITEEKIR